MAPCKRRKDESAKTLPWKYADEHCREAVDSDAFAREATEDAELREARKRMRELETENALPKS